MENVTIKINTTNAAFGEAPAYEVARILRDVARRFEMYGDNCGTEGIIRDANGDFCGSVSITHAEGN